MREKNIVTCILLTIVTCGIYGIIWFVEMTDDVARANNDSELSGGKAFLFTIITCGIYTHYWNYKMGKEMHEAKQKRNIQADDQSILYLVLGIFGLGIVNYCLIQSDLNDMAKKES